MILDHLAFLDRYDAVHPALQEVLASLDQLQLDSMPAGRHDLDGDQLFVIIGHDPGRGRDGAVLEAHRRYIDVQLTLAGDEQIGWKPLAECQKVQLAYDGQRDLALFDDRPDVWLPLRPGTFAIFFPNDAHAPLAGTGELRKAVFKLAVTETGGRANGP